MAKPVDLLALALDRLGPLEERKDAVAAAEREARVGEVVARIRLGEAA
jgi:hypothetical protein